jgi:hypothetical protein
MLSVHIIVTPIEPVTEAQVAELRTQVKKALAKRVSTTMTFDRSLG